MSRSTVTDWFEIIGFLLLAAAAACGLLLPWRESVALAVGGAAMITGSMVLSLLGPKPPPDTGVEAG